MDAKEMKRIGFYGIALALGAATMLLSGQVYAANCYLLQSTVTDSVSSLAIKVQRDAPVGTILSEQNVGPWTWGVAYCNGAAQIYLAMSYAGGITEGNNIYRTNLPGVGVRLSWGKVPFTNPANLGEGISGGYLTSNIHTLQIIKTGPVTSGTLNPGMIGRYYVVSKLDNSSADVTVINMGSGNTVTQLACSLNASNIQVPLGDVLATEFTGVGKTLKPKVFNVGLACDANAKINVSLGGTQNSESSDSSILQLTNAGSAGVAKGVGVQLLYNNTPLKLNQLLALKTSAGGQETFPFTAHYYQTAANITAGSANATATLNISYQ